MLSFDNMATEINFFSEMNLLAAQMLTKQHLLVIGKIVVNGPCA